MIDQGFFTSGDINKRPYTIVIPPPNALENFIWSCWDTTLQDIIIRRKRMQGYDALYLPEWTMQVLQPQKLMKTKKPRN